MRQFCYTGCWVVCALLLSACAKPALEFADGTRGDFTQWSGRWLVVNYWATWCAPCRVEVPELNELNQRPEIAVVGVNFDGVVGAALSDQAVALGIEFPVLVADPRERWQVELPSVLPTTLLINPDGELAEVRRGPQTAAALLSAMGLDNE